MNEKFVYLTEVLTPVNGTQPYPYHLYVSLNERIDFICISEGTGHGSMGGSLTPKEFVSGKWNDYIKIFKAEWLVEVISKIGPSEITAKMIVDIWEKRNTGLTSH